MKLGISTLGCPEWTLEQILTRLPAYGYQGVELRGLGTDLDLTQSPAFATPLACTQTLRQFADAGLEVMSVDSSANFTDTDWSERQGHVDHARATIDLAAQLGVPFVRVFGGNIPRGTAHLDGVARVADSLRMLGAYAEGAGGQAVVLLETHDDFSRGRDVVEVLSLVNHPRVAALWDLHHPFRQGETPAETYAALAPYVKLTHVKDSKPGGTYCLLGEGDVPIREMIGLLNDGGYSGYLNLEWEKRWHPELLDPEVAFPQYAAQLREWLAD